MARTSMENKKYNKHLALARRQGAQFRPFVCETLGAFAEQTDKFFDLIYRFAADRDPADPFAGANAKSAALAAVAIALQRFVADGIRQILLAIRPRAAEWHNRYQNQNWLSAAHPGGR